MLPGHFIWSCANCYGRVFAIADKILFPIIRMEAEPYIPTDIRVDFNEALRSLNGNNAKAAVIMTRSALQGAAGQQGANLCSFLLEVSGREGQPTSLRGSRSCVQLQHGHCECGGLSLVRRVVISRV